MEPLPSIESLSQNTRRHRQLIGNYLIFVFSAFGLWLAWALQFDNLIEVMQIYARFIFLGITGATFASATGAGGGIIFIPVFSSLQFAEAQSIATSFTIQCFGMTAGAISWFLHYKNHHRFDANWSPFVGLSLFTALFAITGFWFSQLAQLASPASLHSSFSLFSMILGLAIIYSCRSLPHNPLGSNHPRVNNQYLVTLDYLAMAAIGFLGGIITAWLSVGVGELIVIYLMLRGFCAKMAVATGVVVSAITVWSASPVHVFSGDSQALFELVLFAGPGAIIGGYLARKLAIYLSVKKLKLFFAIWIILTGFVMLLQG